MGQYLGAVPERSTAREDQDLRTVDLREYRSDAWNETAPAMSEWTENLVRLEGHWQEHRANWKLAGAAIVDVVRSHLNGGGATNYVSAEWVFPNFVLIRSRHATLVVVLQPTAMDQTVWRLSFFSEPGLARATHEAARGNLQRLLDQASKVAEALQSEIELSLASDVTDRLARAGRSIRS